jgi:uncharacterized CHY-type Zn-finger protein
MYKSVMKEAGFGREVLFVKYRKCPFCHTEIYSGDFKDELSKNEYKISGLCQKCQDETFG